MSTKTHLYRHFAKDGSLLYVGISVNAYARLAQHLHGADWPSLAVRMETQTFETREEAHVAERKAIRTEKPIFNRARYEASTKKTQPTELDRARELARKRRGAVLGQLEVRMSNELVMARQGIKRMSTIRTTRLAMALTGEGDSVTVSASDYAAAYDSGLDTCYEAMADAAEELREAVATISGDEVPWVTRCEYANGALTLDWHPAMRGHFQSSGSFSFEEPQQLLADALATRVG